MIEENIKNILGEELTSQVEAAFKGKGKDGKDIDLVIGNDGTYVPADKHEQVKGQAISAENALKAAAKALKEIGGSGDPAKIAEDVKTAQATIDTLQSNHQSALLKIQKNAALRMALADKVHDPVDIISLLDLEQIEVDETGALKNDMDELLKPYKESKPYLFKEDKPDLPEIKGIKPADPGISPKTYTQEEIENMSIEEYRTYREQQSGFPRN